MAKKSAKWSAEVKGLSRRSFVANALTGLTSALVLVDHGVAKDLNYPPVFRTQRHQFTIIEPAAHMRSVVLTDDKMRPKRLDVVPGKILLLNFWATWCDACRYDLPLLERFTAKFADRVNVAAVSIDSAGQLDRVEPYLTELSIRTLPIYLDPERHLASNSSRSAAPFFLASGIPVTYLITPSGRIAGYILGIADWLSDDAQKLLTYYADG